MKQLKISGNTLEYVRLVSAHPRPAAPPMVFLHEGLGSISMWRDFPQQLADATGCEAIVYSRYGYGRSTALRSVPRDVRYMHDEALRDLPLILDALDVREPFLFGHSDGGSISLIHAGGAGRAVAGTIVLAPHVFVEDVALENIEIAGMAYQNPETRLRERLARHHNDVDGAFWGWNRTWLSPAFRSWNIENYLPAIQGPVLAIQGEDDEYATMEQLERIAAGAPDVDLVKLADCRHSPHKDQPGAVIEASASFVARILDARD